MTVSAGVHCVRVEQHLVWFVRFTTVGGWIGRVASTQHDAAACNNRKIVHKRAKLRDGDALRSKDTDVPQALVR